MPKLRFRRTFGNTEKVLQAVEPLVMNVAKRSTPKYKNYRSDPYVVKAEILNNLDDDFCISKVRFGKDPLTAICVTYDDKYAIVSNSKDIIIIDLETKSEYHTFKDAHFEAIQALVVTRDNSVLISCANDSSIKVWDLENLRLLYRFPQAHESGISTVALTADDKYIVSASGDKCIKVWDLVERCCVTTILRAHTEDIFALTVTSDSQYIISGSMDKCISIWKFGTWDLLYCFKNAHFGGVISFKLSEDNTILYSASGDGSIGIWDLVRREPVYTFINAHANCVMDLTLINSGRFVISASWDCTLSVWDAETKTHLHSFKSFNDLPLFSVEVTHDGRYIIATGEEGFLFFIDLGQQKQKCILENIHTKTIGDLKVSKNGTFLVTGSDDSRICVWNLETKKQVWEASKEVPHEIWSIDISPDSKRIATGCSDGTIDVWTLHEKNHLFACDEPHSEGVGCVIFTEDGENLVTASHGTSICIRSSRSPELIYQLYEAHKDSVLTLDITNDSKYMFSGSFDKSIGAWDLKGGRLMYRLEGAHDADIWKVKLTSDDKLLISSSSDRTIKVWDLLTRSAIHTFKTSHQTHVKGLDIVHDDSFIISTDINCVVEVHNLKAQQRAYVYNGLAGGESHSTTITPDDEYIIISRDNSVYMLENPFDQLMVQYSDDCSPYTLLRFMPLASFFSNNSLVHRQKVVRSYPELKIHPHGWNWFHIVAIFSPVKEMISTCFESQIPFTIDLFGKTPLHYLVEHEGKHIASVNLILERFDAILDKSQKPCKILDSIGDIVFKLIELDNIHVINFLNLCIREPELGYGEVLDTHGKIKRHKKVSIAHSTSMAYNSDIRMKLISYSYKHKVSVKFLPFCWDYTLTSECMKTLVNTLSNINSQGIFETKIVCLLIRSLWRSSKWFYYFLGMLFSVQAILISIYMGFEEQYVVLDIPIFALAVFFLIYEIFEGVSAGLRDYLKTVWNYFDAAANLLIPATLIALRVGLEQDVKQWLFSFILAFTYIRWISYFRVFKQTRNLIRMVVEIFRDIRSFAMVLAFIIFGLSLIFLQFDRETPYSTHLLNSYRLLYSDFDLDALNSPAMMFYFLIVIAVVSIVLLNMLIAIMGQTFGEVEEKSLIVDSKEVLELISECMRVRRTLKCLTSWKKDEGKGKRYLFFAEAKVDEEANSEKLENDVAELKEYIEEQVSSLNKKLSKHVRQKDINLLKEEIAISNKQVSALTYRLRKPSNQGEVELIKANVNVLNEQVAEINSKLAKQEQQMNEQLVLLRELVQAMKKDNPSQGERTQGEITPMSLPS